MKLKLLLVLPFLGVLLWACNPNSDTKSLTVKEYFAPQDSGVQSAGVKMIPVETPIGTFKVWTKTIGNNPKIKVLLLHGGPAMTHEYLESFEVSSCKKDSK